MTMIYFLTVRRASDTIDLYLENVAPEMRSLIVPLHYERWLKRQGHREQGHRGKGHPPGVYLLADIERLSPKQMARTAAIGDQLSETGQHRFINHPLKTLRRYDLLRLMHARGTNQFQAFRPKEIDESLRYPVFVRGENDHKGAQSQLLSHRGELDQAIRRLTWQWKGWRDKVVTEFCDTADENGVYRKYAAFKIGSRILPRSLFFSHHWMLKSWDLMTDTMVAEEQEYIFSNPHEEQLQSIFAAANIDYGRIDYALLDGKIQVWEINTNPALPSGYSPETAPRTDVLKWFRGELAEAFHTLNAPTAERASAA